MPDKHQPIAQTQAEFWPMEEWEFPYEHAEAAYDDSLHTSLFPFYPFFFFRPFPFYGPFFPYAPFPYRRFHRRFYW